jgi:lipopolysaccharide transport system ATP-binding protein
MAPSEGRVQTHGRIAALLELGAGFSPMLTGRENVLIHGVMHGMSDAEIQERLPYIERFADIGEFFDRPLRSYSSGMAMRLGFAAAIHYDPDILIVDEALAVGDALFQNRCFTRIEEIKRAGAAILFVSHSSEAVVRLCDRAIVMDGGRAIFDGDARAARDVYENMLFGSGPALAPPAPQAPEPPAQVDVQADAPAASPAAAGAGPQAAIDAFCSSAGDAEAYRTRRGFNAHHVRLGEARWAQLCDYLIVSGGQAEPPRLRQGDMIEIYAKFRCLEARGNVNTGIGITTLEGLMVYGTNSVMQRRSVGPLAAGSIVIARYRFPVRLAQGKYMLNIGIGEAEETSGADFQDVRRGICALFVDGPATHSGLVNLEAELTLLEPAPA